MLVHEMLIDNKQLGCKLIILPKKITVFINNKLVHQLQERHLSVVVLMTLMLL